MENDETRLKRVEVQLSDRQLAADELAGELRDWALSTAVPALGCAEDKVELAGGEDAADMFRLWACGFAAGVSASAAAVERDGWPGEWQVFAQALLDFRAARDEVAACASLSSAEQVGIRR